MKVPVVSLSKSCPASQPPPPGFDVQACTSLLPTPNTTPADYISGQLRAIVGVELSITRLEGRWKMSQNRPSRDIDGVVSALGASPLPGEREVADIVERVRPG